VRVLATVITIGIGFITLLALLLGNWFPIPDFSIRLNSALNVLLPLTSITIALTILIGVLNLLTVHMGRIMGRRGGAISSVFLILSFVLVITTYFVQRSTSFMLLNTVQVSIESALAALVLFALVYGAATIMRRRTSIAGILFVVAVLIVLIGALPLQMTGGVTSVRDWLLAVPVNAGARGILLGIALATVVAGVRVLIGQDRSYRE
jgi:hypothetical protein